eukprot:scaffold4558_cov80-Skeletonema_marinoi.AAC.4
MTHRADVENLNCRGSNSSRGLSRQLSARVRRDRLATKAGQKTKKQDRGWTAGVFRPPAPALAPR